MIEDPSIFREIDEELKQDEMYKWLKKNKDAITGVICAIVVLIIAGSSLYARKQQQQESITNALVDVLRSPSRSHAAALIESLLDDAPAEMRPLLVILKDGRNLQSSKETKESAEELLDLTRKGGVDIVWKDLALLIYASYNLVDSKQEIELLKPLTAEDRPFKFMAMEMLAFLHLSHQQKDDAIKYLKSILEHKDAPESLKTRISMILNHIQNKEEGK